MKSIQSRLLFLLFIFIIVPYFLSVLLIYWFTKENVERHELEISHQEMLKTSKALEQYFNDMVNLPNNLYRNPDLFRIFEEGFENSIYFNQLEIDKGMKNFYLMRNEISQVRIYINKGQDSFTVYNAMVSARKRHPDIMKQASIRKLMNSNKDFLIVPPHTIENYNNSAIMAQSDIKTVLTIHHKIVDDLLNEFLGIVTMDINFNGFASLCNQLIHTPKDSVLLYDSDGHVIYASNQSMMNKPLSDELQQKINRSGGDYSSGGNIVFSRTLSGPLEQWHLVKITSSQYLFREVRKTAYTNIIVGVVVVGLGLLMIGIISDKITRPIKQLSRKVLSIEGGNRNVPFDDNREDEIGYLERHIKDMMNRINQHIEREYILEIENRKFQLKALKSQINPHFLYNSLQSIGAVAYFSDSPQIYELITSLSKMMRYSIREDQRASVRSEADYVRAYLSLQKERFETDFSYSIDIPETILDIPVPNMILQPLAENFFKHCYEKGFHQAYLRIYGEMQGEHLNLVVENNGPGLTNSELIALKNKIYSPASGTYSDDHIGLKNIHDRLVLNYGTTAGIQLDSKEGQGFSVRLVIPLKLREDGHNESTNR